MEILPERTSASCPADDLVAGLFGGILIDHADRGAELHLRAGELGDIDDLGPRMRSSISLMRPSIQPCRSLAA